jgi:hypothetical protein
MRRGAEAHSGNFREKSGSRAMAPFLRYDQRSCNLTEHHPSGKFFAQMRTPAKEPAMSRLGPEISARWTRRRVLQTTAAAIASSSLVSRFALAADAAGTLVWGKSLETTMIDPHMALVGSSWQLQFLVYETLTSMGDNFDV